MSGTLNDCEDIVEENFYGDQEYNLWVRLTQAKDVIFRAREKELSKYEITAMQAAVLFTIKAIIATEGKATPGKISRWLFREPHSISRILSRMENESLVNKTKGSGKKNEIDITLTEKGENLAKELIRHARLLETLLYNELELSAKEAHNESEKFNLLFSCNTINKICEKYEHPSECPCGDTILSSINCYCEKE